MDTLAPPLSRIVLPGQTRLALTRGDFLIVKQQLNAGETFDLFERAAPDVDLTVPGALQHLPPGRVGVAMVTAYLLDWSVTDADGHVIPIRGTSQDDTAAALRLLDFESMIEIINAITAHDARIRQEKKLRSATDGS